MKVREEKLPNDKNVFYDSGKYIERSITRYGKEKIDDYYEIENEITDELAPAFRDNNLSATPITTLFNRYGLGSSDEIDACLVISIIAEFIASYSDDNTVNNDKH